MRDFVFLGVNMAVTIRRRNPTAITQAHRSMVARTKKEVAVGFPAGKAQAYPDGTPLVPVAAAHVYGIGVPKRDFMGLAMDDIVNNTAPIIKSALTVDDPTALYNAAGLSAETSIKKAIVDLQDPPNSPITVAAKGFNNPLIETGHMLQSVTYVVRDRTR